ncbi:MAG: DUF1926 domain-containing protein [candidate division Zixibacteria bacterium]|nr:DUF1926 domain-containing protein [candidate division Zixibacteria bacterium]
MGKFKLAIGLHNHQPIGNFDHIFEETHHLAYAPFIKLLLQYENIRLSLHQSGILWNWQEQNHPEYLEKIKKLVKQNRVELMTGGFYEPILPSIPDRDKKGQIKLLNKYLNEKFDVDPTGLWLTERVWEPHLPKTLKQSGVQYLPIDDTHFLYAGFGHEELKGVFVTEEEGYQIRLLPIQKRLRYLIPFGTVEEIINELKQQAETNPGGMAIYADDGEKFGGWPGTNKHCYKEKWLEQFFAALEYNSDWLEVCPLGEVATTEPVGRAYLQSASYSEMLHWSLPPQAFVEYEEFEQWVKDSGKIEQYGRFIRGGHWRGFLGKYPESNLMHKRMLAVSKKLIEYEKLNPNDTKTINEVREYLYAGQCNCSYWHGVFGGLYLPHLRSAIFENLIKAEKILIGVDRDNTETVITDYDCDGLDEIVVTTNKFISVIKPSTGGSMVELNCLESNFNATDILNRRREGYHRKLSSAIVEGSVDESHSIHDSVLAKEDGLENLLAEDWYLRRCFIDHFFGDDVNIDNFSSGKFHDSGNFVLEPYQHIKESDPGKIDLRRFGFLNQDNASKAIRIDKRYHFSLDSEAISVNYCLTALNEDIHNARFAVECNFNFLAGHSDDRYILFNGQKIEKGYLDATVVRDENNSIIMQDDWRDFAVAMMVNKTSQVWQCPIFTVSLSEGGFEKVYQGTSLVNLFDLNLKKGVPTEISFLLFAGKPETMPNRFHVNENNIVTAGL